MKYKSKKTSKVKKIKITSNFLELKKYGKMVKKKYNNLTVLIKRKYM